jgi:phospholipase C
LPIVVQAGVDYGPAGGRGLRVPMVIVSPFAKKRFVDHTVYDMTIG